MQSSIDEFAAFLQHAEEKRVEAVKLDDNDDAFREMIEDLRLLIFDSFTLNGCPYIHAIRVVLTYAMGRLGLGRRCYFYTGFV